MSLNQQHALITGGSRGIGRGIALKLAENGVKVGIHYYCNESAANDTLVEVRRRGSEGFVVQADVCRPEEITRMFGEVRKRFGKLEILVSNARPEAAEFFQPPMDITLQQWDAALDSQAKAFLIAAREAAALMSEGGRTLAITYAQGRHRQSAAVGGHGFGKGGARVARALLRSGTSQTRHYGQCDQPWMDGEQRAEQPTGARAGSHQELAQPWLDTDGTPGDTGRHRQNCGAVLL